MRLRIAVFFLDTIRRINPCLYPQRLRYVGRSVVLQNTTYMCLSTLKGILCNFFSLRRLNTLVSHTLWCGCNKGLPVKLVLHQPLGVYMLFPMYPPLHRLSLRSPQECVANIPVSSKYIFSIVYLIIFCG